MYYLQKTIVAVTFISILFSAIGCMSPLTTQTLQEEEGKWVAPHESSESREKVWQEPVERSMKVTQWTGLFSFLLFGGPEAKTYGQEETRIAMSERLRAKAEVDASRAEVNRQVAKNIATSKDPAVIEALASVLLTNAPDGDGSKISVATTGDGARGSVSVRRSVDRTTYVNYRSRLSAKDQKAIYGKR